MSETRSGDDLQDRPAGDSPAGSYSGLSGAESSEITTGSGAGWSGTGDDPATSESRGGSAREWLGQLQGMIDNVATQAAPVMREIAAKAAELAAAAGDKAGPLAHKAAEVTEAAGAKLAERGRGVAADLRGSESDGQGAAAGDTPNTIEPGPAARPSFGSDDTTTSITDDQRNVGE